MKTLTRWTVADYHRMVDAGILADKRVELISGEIIDMSPEGPLHAYRGESLGDFFRDRLSGRALVREARPITLANSEPEPDLALVRGTREDYKHRHPGPQDIFLVVEISNSTLDKDLNEKKQAYAKAGLPEYWVLDLKHDLFIVFRNPVKGEYQERQEISSGKINLLAFPDVSMSASQCFR